MSKPYYKITLGPTYVLAVTSDVSIAEQLFYTYKFSGSIRYPELLEAHYIKNGKQYDALLMSLTRDQWKKQRFSMEI